MCAAVTAFFACGLLLQWCEFSHDMQTLIVICIIVCVLALFPKATAPVFAPQTDYWEILTRMGVADMLVLTLTVAAPLLGASLSGLIGTFPIYATILAVYAHRTRGSASAQNILFGMLMGLFGFVGFFFVLSIAIGQMDIRLAFASAALFAMFIQGISLMIMRNRLTANRQLAQSSSKTLSQSPSNRAFISALAASIRLASVERATRLVPNWFWRTNG
jgi:hypothetical protein